MSLLTPTRNFFHAGYVVRNISAVTEKMRVQFGIERWKILPLPEGSPASAIALAGVGGATIELVEVNPDGELLNIHQGFAPTAVSEARLNHLAYILDSEEELEAVVANFEASGTPTAFLASFGDIFSRYYYADTVAQLGHYCEFVCLGPSGRAFLAEIPQN